MKKYLDSNGLLYFWSKIKTYVTSAISNKADKGTTLSSYGITDAKINNGTITLGDNTITPLTSHQDISGKANLASPTFTGTPKAPTAASGTNTTQIATTAFVQSAISASASAVAVKSVDTTAGTSGINLSLDSNGKLDVTISSGSIASDDTNFVTGGTVYSTTNLLAPKASPALTGTPTAPTAAAGTNTTQIATTAFVTSAVGNYILTSAKGAANGVCPLDANSLIDSSYLPSYVDDVVEAYPVSGATELSSTWLAAGSASGTVITPETGKIYVLMADSTSYAANSQFRWSGTAYIKMADGGVSEITNAEIDTIVAA